MRTPRNGRTTLTLLALAIFAATPAAHAQSFSVMYNFGTNAGDPTNPQYGAIAQGRDGNMYSTALGGAIGAGAMFQITPSGMLSVPYSFDSTDSGPYSGLTLGTDGNFYGATAGGGTSGAGTVFKITSSGTVTLLHSFSVSDGYQPYEPPIQGTDGNFYGTTSQGGTNSLGTVYKITPSGTLTTLYSFDNTHGDFPHASLVQGTDGNFYGTTIGGGTNGGWGVVYKITASGKLTVIYNFDLTHGGQPISPLVQGSDGNFYGTTSQGGTPGYGVVFEITSAGKLTVLHGLNGTTDGYAPIAGLVQATDGNFYGSANQGGNSANCTGGCGTIFRISPIKPYHYKPVYNFDDTTGQLPQVTLIQHTNGILYGDTQEGGTGNVNPCSVGVCGVFYSLNIGAVPFASLVSASGKVGKTVGILGQGFTKKTTSVSFAGTAGTLTYYSATYIAATVPSGATTGSVIVTTPSGKLTSNKVFRVTPQITSFSPTSGAVGIPVQINGVSLTQTTKVTFGGVIATSFTVNSDMQVTATVPTGAKTGHITITTPGGTAVSPGIFTVTQ
jgi:uncharacterized repeat protein (TIGR03803 family)